MFRGVQCDVIRYEFFTRRQQFLHDRMATVSNLNLLAFVYLRSAIILFGGYNSK